LKLAFNGAERRRTHLVFQQRQPICFQNTGSSTSEQLSHVAEFVVICQ
jgi:hypothetical protein